MPDRRSQEPLSDAALDREIEKLLAVDPAPAFAARVRTRVAAERRVAPPLLWWGLVSAGMAVTTAVLLVIAADETVVHPPGQRGFVAVGFPGDRELMPQDASVPARVTGEPAVATLSARPPRAAVERAPVVARSQSGPARVPRRLDTLPLPEVLVPPDETDAWHRYLALVREGVVPAPPLADGGAVSLEPITIAPLAIEALALVQGESE